MKVSTGSNESMKVVRRFIITEGEPVVAMAYSQPPKKVRIDRGVIQYTWRDGGWQVESEWAVNLTGTVLLKSGLPGKNTHTRHPDSDPAFRREPFLVLAEGWEWLDEIISLLRPSGEVSVEQLSEYEVRA